MSHEEKPEGRRPTPNPTAARTIVDIQVSIADGGSNSRPVACFVAKADDGTIWFCSGREGNISPWRGMPHLPGTPTKDIEPGSF